MHTIVCDRTARYTALGLAETTAELQYSGNLMQCHNQKAERQSDRDAVIQPQSKSVWYVYILLFDGSVKPLLGNRHYIFITPLSTRLLQANGQLISREFVCGSG